MGQRNLKCTVYRTTHSVKDQSREQNEQDKKH